MLFIDAGDFTGDADIPGEKLTAALVEGMNALDYTAANLSRREFLHGYDTFVKRRAEARFPFVSANIVWQRTGKPVVDPFRIEKVRLRQGAAVREVRIGFIGLSKADPTFMEEGPDGRRIVTIDPVTAALTHLPELSRKADVVVVLSSMGLPEAQRFARKVKGVDLILGGQGSRRTRNTDFPEDTQFGRARILYIGDQGKNLGEVRIFFNDRKAIVSTQRSVVGLTAAWPEEPKLAALMERTKKDVNDWNRAQASALNPFAEVPVGDGPVYTGSERCAPCHENAFARWARTGHAHAFQTLVHDSQEFNPKCVGCHTSGFGKPHGFVNAKATPRLVNVGCESCHGPSSRHPDTELEGYGRTSVRYCVSCHTRDNSPDYDPAIYIPVIQHWESNPRAAR